MKNIKLILSYDGTNYHGWAIQPDVNTICGTLKKALKELTGEEIKVICASRTDAKVHARTQVVNFFTNSRIPIEAFPRALNSHLPEDIVVYDASYVDDTFHARFSAKYRKYHYLLINSKYPDVFYRHYTYWLPFELNLEKMRQACEFLIGTHDFSAFASEIKTVKNPIRDVQQLSISTNACLNLLMENTPNKFWFPEQNEIIFFNIKANAFLFNMIRTIVGTLIDVGREKLAPIDVKHILESKDRAKASPLVPPQGLYLIEVGY
ncbi:MAG: tRNA pseudouridine(38-40) synthase TruA [bacterium]